MSGNQALLAIPTTEYKPIPAKEHDRVVKTLSRVETKLLPEILPNGEKTVAAATREALHEGSVNVYKAPAEEIKNDLIKAAIDANPLSTVDKIGIYSAPLPIVARARRAAAARAGKMLDFCNRPRLGPNSIRTHNALTVNSSTRIEKEGAEPSSKKSPRSYRRNEQHEIGIQNISKEKAPKSKQKKKLTRSQRKGRARLSMERGERLLSSYVSPKKLPRSKSATFTPERIKEWFDDIPEQDRLCELPASSLYLSVKGDSIKSKNHSTNLSELIVKDEENFQKRFAAKRKKRTKGAKKRKEGNREEKLIKRSKPTEYFGVNSNLASPAENFDATKKVIVGFDTLRRGQKPKRAPPRLEAFWAAQEKTGVGHKLLSDGYTLSEFEIDPSNAYSKLAVSKEMQETIKRRVLGGNHEVREGTDKQGKGGSLRRTKSMTNIWEDFWTDEVGSELAAPLTSAIFVSSNETLLDGETASQDAPAFVDDGESVAARLPYAGRRFQYAVHAHAAASRIQHVYHLRRKVRDDASSCISSCFRGYLVRRHVVEKRRRLHASALLIASAFRGMQARRHASFIRATGWNNVAIVCQRAIRRHLAKRELERRRRLHIFNAAACIQRRVRGIKGRLIARQRKMSVRDKAAKCIQNMVRYVNFKDALDSYRFLMVISTEDIQRVFRGHVGRSQVRFIRKNISAATNIERTWRGHLGRRRFKRKMDIVRTASTIIQVRIRGIISRRIAADTRQMALEAESIRTKREEGTCARKLATTQDFLITKAGKKEMKERLRDIIAENRADAFSSGNLTAGLQKRRLLALKRGFQLVDFRSTGLIDRNQFEELLLKTLHIAMSSSQVDSAWAKTATVKAKRGGYRLCDIGDQRELCEIVPWFTSGEDRPTGWKSGLGRLGLKFTQSVSCQPGKNTRNAQKRVFLRTRLECLETFRRDIPPPFACSECTKRFVFSYELENHLNALRTKTCPGKYFTPGLDN